MILPPRTFAAIAVAMLLSVLAVRVGIGGAFDPFADFYYLTGIRTAEYRSVEQFAERKIKRRMIEDMAADDIRLAIFGNSRSAIIDPTLLDPKGVNLSFSGARTEEVTLLLKRFKALHPQAQAVMALDFDQCFAPEQGNPLYLDPASDALAAKDALARLVAIGTLEDWVKAEAASQGFPQRVAQRGNIVRVPIGRAQIDARRKIDVEIYRSFFGGSRVRPDCTSVVRAARAADPHVVFFVNPISADILAIVADTGWLAELDEWRRQIHQLGPVLDFSCSEALRQGDYADGHHYGPQIAGRMAAELRAFLAGEPASAPCPSASVPAPPSRAGGERCPKCGGQT